jgi:hypothetical protein
MGSVASDWLGWCSGHRHAVLPDWPAPTAAIPLQTEPPAACRQHAWPVPAQPMLDAPVAQPANDAVAPSSISAITQPARIRLRLFIGEIIPYVTF